MTFERKGIALINRDPSEVDAARKRRDNVKEMKKKEELLLNAVSRIDKLEAMVLELQNQINQIRTEIRHDIA